MRVLVTGATGCVGTAVLRRLVATGAAEPVATYRSGDHEQRLEKIGVAARLRCDLRELPSRIAGAGPLDACVHAAAAVHGRQPDPAMMAAINTDQTLALARALAATEGFRRLVFISTIAVSQSERHEGPVTPYAASKAAAEEGLGALAEELGFELVVLRLATVYGAHDRGNIASLYRAIARRMYVRLVAASTPKALVDAGAVGAAVEAALTLPSPPRLSTVVDPAPYALAAVEDALAEAAGVAPPWRLPAALGYLAAAAGSTLQALSRRGMPLSLASLRVLRRPVDIRPAPDDPLAAAGHAALAGTLADRFRAAYRTDA